jgi:hypothetical protein
MKKSAHPSDAQENDLLCRVGRVVVEDVRQLPHERPQVRVGDRVSASAGESSECQRTAEDVVCVMCVVSIVLCVAGERGHVREKADRGRYPVLDETDLRQAEQIVAIEQRRAGEQRRTSFTCVLRLM